MRTVQLLGLGVLTVLSSAFKVANTDIETCSIKEESSCSGPLHPEDKSYTFRLGNQVDSEVIFKNQMKIYFDLKEKLLSEPYFPIFVETKGKSYEDTVRKELKKFVKNHEKLSFLKKLPSDQLFATANFFPGVLRNVIFEEVPLSRISIANEAYTEHVLHVLKNNFPTEISSKHNMSEEQKNLIVRYGALAVLIAQGIAKNVKVKT